MKSSPKNIILCSILLLCSFAAYTQTNYIDSLQKALQTQKADTNKVTTLIRLSDVYRFSNPDSGLFYGQEALSLAEKLHSDNHIFWSIVSVNGSLYVLGNYTLELDFAFKALPIAKKLNNPYTTGYSNGMLSDCYYNLGEYSTALKYWREVIKISDQISSDEQYGVYGNSARLFSAMEQYDSALIYAKKSYELIKNNPSLNKDTSGMQWAKSSIFTSLGDAFAGKADYDSALFYYRISLPLSEVIQMEVNKMDAFYGIAKVYKEKNNLDSAAWYAKEVLTWKIAKSYPISLLKAVNLLSDIYKSKKNADSTLKYLQLALILKDSLFNREKTIAFQNILFKENEKQKELEDAKAKLQRQYNMYFLAAGIIALLIIAGVLLKNQRLKQMQNMRNSIADDLHDDIGSSLSSISIMSELAKAKLPESMPLLVSIGESTNTIQENMSDIVWAVNPKNDRFENVLQRMNQFASEMLDAKNIELEFTSDPSLAASKLTMGQRKNFYLFFKEVINNAAKYSGAKKISVSIAQENHHIEMNIRDNGNGFDTKTIFNSNGMSTLKKRAAELGAHFNIQSQINEGTGVQLTFKIT